MEKRTDESEISSSIYQFIDQAYSWALEGMKFVITLKMDECLNFEVCRKMIEDFDKYMNNHPAIPEDDFTKVKEMCARCGNLKCLRQCSFAQQKCDETLNLFNKRRQLLEKIKVQFKTSNKKRINDSFRLKSKEKTVRVNSEVTKREKISKLLEFSACENGKSSINSTSSSSISSSGFCESIDSSRCSSASNSFADFGEVDYSLKSTSKPARKVLKKSCSTPSHQVTPRALSHVHSQSGGTITIGSPVQVDKSPEASGKPKVDLIIEELIATEKKYVRSLNYVVENYFPEMCRLDIPQSLRCKRNIIFGNIEKIAQFHSGYFLRDLQNCNGNPLLVAKTFQRHKESFGLYALYSKNKPMSDQLLQEHGNEFFKARQAELGDKMNLASYLLKPVQRMGKYALMLHAMSKHCSPEEMKSLKEAEELVKFQLRHGNDLLTMDSIQDCDVNLKEQGNLLRQEQFVIFCGRRKIVRRVFLFEELILFSKPLHIHGGHDIYQYKCSYKTAEIGLTENIGESGYKFEIWFRRRRQQATQDRFVLQSASRSVKRAWVEEIRGILWQQALRNKDHRQIELSSMGVGSKPHLDLVASSENRITDRAVIMLPPCDASMIADRLAKSRTRASIAVSSFEHSSQDNKRPHSIISTSSSSSSVGSTNFQSFSLISSLHLASWPPKINNKPANGFSPPMAYCDFHVIAEDSNEESETTNGSSLFASNGDISNTQIKSPASRQFVTTPNHQLAIN